MSRGCWATRYGDLPDIDLRIFADSWARGLWRAVCDDRSMMINVAGDEEIETTIIRYVRRNPESADTAEGVSDWWLHRKRRRIDVQSVARALERLTESGVLERFGIDENARYRLRRDAKT